MAALGKAHREELSLVELSRRFPDDAAAQEWLEKQRWGGEPWCPKCGSTKVGHDNHKSMPWRCAVRSCRKRFSVRVGTVLQGSHLGYRTWVLAIHLLTTSPRVQSSMKLHRDLNITQKTAWFLAYRIHKAFADQSAGGGGLFSNPVEVDETYVGCKRSNMSKAQCVALADTGAGRGTVGNTPVADAKDRVTNQVAAEVVPSATKPVLQGFVGSHGADEAVVYIDGASV